MGIINFNMRNVHFSGSSSIIRELHNEGGEKNEELIRELHTISRTLKDIEPLIANTVDNLAEAVEKNNQPAIKKWARMLAKGTAQDVLSTLASAALMKFITG